MILDIQYILTRSSGLQYYGQVIEKIKLRNVADSINGIEKFMVVTGISMKEVCKSQIYNVKDLKVMIGSQAHRN